MQALSLDPDLIRRPGICSRSCTHQPTCAATLEHQLLQQLFDIALARLTANEITRRGAVHARAECRWRDCGATAAADADDELANPSDESRSRFVEHSSAHADAVQCATQIGISAHHGHASYGHARAPVDEWMNPWMRHEVRAGARARARARARASAVASFNCAPIELVDRTVFHALALR